MKWMVLGLLVLVIAVSGCTQQTIVCNRPVNNTYAEKKLCDILNEQANISKAKGFISPYGKNVSIVSYCKVDETCGYILTWSNLVGVHWYYSENGDLVETCRCSDVPEAITKYGENVYCLSNNNEECKSVDWFNCIEIKC